MKKSDSKPTKTIDWEGLKICIESPIGSKRTWFDNYTLKPGVTLMRFDYGYIEGAEGLDGDSLDCYFGPDPSNKDIYVVRQTKPGLDKTDEYKVMIAFHSIKHAKNSYMRQYDDGEKYFGDIESYSLDQFKKKFIDKVAKSLEEQEVQEQESPQSFNFDDISTVTHILAMLESLQDEEILEIASAIWGQENLSELNNLRYETEGFLLDQQEILNIVSGQPNDIDLQGQSPEEQNPEMEEQQL